MLICDKYQGDKERSDLFFAAVFRYIVQQGDMKLIFAIFLLEKFDQGV